QPYNDGLGWNQTEFTSKSKGEIVTTPKRAGAAAAKFTLHYPDKRAEKNKFSAGAPGSERWFGFSTYIPEKWPNHDNVTIVAQIKSMPDAGEPHRSPFLSFELRNGVWTIYNRWDANKISKPEAYGSGGTIKTKQVYSGSYTRGTWTDWVIHAKWSYNKDGLLEIWKNGTKLVSWVAPNCYNDTDYPFHFKIGMYKPGYNSTHPSPLVIYHDEVRIGNENARYSDVAPG
ncbi:MAG: polysaccharide lyase, partial [Coleofasciculus sp. S288]|nr:polysaccharide lyase [Coleofasciculus sp. S288]